MLVSSRPWEQQPQEPVRISRAWESRVLFALACTPASRGVEPASNRPLRAYGAPVFTHEGIRFDSNAAGLYVPQAARERTNAYTNLILVRRLGTVASYAGFVGSTFNGNDTSPYGDQIDCGTTGGSGLRFAYNAGGNPYEMVTGTALSTTVFEWVVATFRPGSQKLYKNGQLIGSQTVAGNPSWGANAQLIVGQGDNLARNPNIIVRFAARVNYEMSPQEIVALMPNPRVMFEGLRVWVPVRSAAATPVILVSAQRVRTGGSIAAAAGFTASPRSGARQRLGGVVGAAAVHTAQSIAARRQRGAGTASTAFSDAFDSKSAARQRRAGVATMASGFTAQLGSSARVRRAGQAVASAGFAARAQSAARVRGSAQAVVAASFTAVLRSTGRARSAGLPGLNVAMAGQVNAVSAPRQRNAGTSAVSAAFAVATRSAARTRRAAPAQAASEQLASILAASAARARRAGAAAAAWSSGTAFFSAARTRSSGRVGASWATAAATRSVARDRRAGRIAGEMVHAAGTLGLSRGRRGGAVVIGDAIWLVPNMKRAAWADAVDRQAWADRVDREVIA